MKRIMIVALLSLCTLMGCNADKEDIIISSEVETETMTQVETEVTEVLPDVSEQVVDYTPFFYNLGGQDLLIGGIQADIMSDTATMYLCKDNDVYYGVTFTQAPVPETALMLDDIMSMSVNEYMYKFRHTLHYDESLQGNTYLLNNGILIAVPHIADNGWVESQDNVAGDYWKYLTYKDDLTIGDVSKFHTFQYRLDFDSSCYDILEQLYTDNTLHIVKLPMNKISSGVILKLTENGLAERIKVTNMTPMSSSELTPFIEGRDDVKFIGDYSSYEEQNLAEFIDSIGVHKISTTGMVKEYYGLQVVKDFGKDYVVFNIVADVINEDDRATYNTMYNTNGFLSINGKPADLKIKDISCDVFSYEAEFTAR